MDVCTLFRGIVPSGENVKREVRFKVKLERKDSVLTDFRSDFRNMNSGVSFPPTVRFNAINLSRRVSFSMSDVRTFFLTFLM